MMFRTAVNSNYAIDNCVKCIDRWAEKVYDMFGTFVCVWRVSGMGFHARFGRSTEQSSFTNSDAAKNGRSV